MGRKNTILLLVGFCVALGATFFFGYRAGRTARDARWQNEPIRGWMTVPFIAHTHHVSEDDLFNAIHVPPTRRNHRPIRDIAKEQRLPVSSLLKELNQALAQNGQPERK